MLHPQPARAIPQTDPVVTRPDESGVLARIEPAKSDEPVANKPPLTPKEIEEREKHSAWVRMMNKSLGTSSQDGRHDPKNRYKRSKIEIFFGGLYEMGVLTVTVCAILCFVVPLFASKAWYLTSLVTAGSLLLTYMIFYNVRMSIKRAAERAPAPESTK